MDPLTALGLAANVIQFVDFASKLFSPEKEIHEVGTSKQNLDLGVIVDDLNAFSFKFRKGMGPFGNSSVLTEDDRVRSFSTSVTESR